ncbi:MarR family winged helix-turn-helix transcriptional regulator [Novosphingobium sp. KACC 22771]|uniref:MarR family winged helix-turn-helix transcriptional regulator n=1 Tax=Novosphingobium sp. KACC 22771 TaxID=3025670 RepID=UPI00236737A4|nr:MarR family transcriptional regulator [Novosphingobium sp. KACC 22771]WDF74531.1 MarR family transcriptional regulator [Novosphingobium sp. KACC 22771]
MRPSAPPPSRLSGLIGFHLRRVSAQSLVELESALMDLDLRTIHFAVLAAIESSPGGKQREIAAEAKMRPANLVPLLDQLEKRGLVRRSEDGSDRRLVRFSLTAAGQDMLVELDRRVRLHEERFFAAFDEKEREALIAMMRRIGQS